MKKFLTILLLSVSVLLLATSCKTADCPAYAKANTETNSQVNS